MTFVELVFLAAGGVGIYLLFRPLRRWLDRSLQRISLRSPPSFPRLHLKALRLGPRDDDIVVINVPWYPDVLTGHNEASRAAPRGATEK